jgi:O-antigen/teichoic acid export membrane protein
MATTAWARLRAQLADRSFGDILKGSLFAGGARVFATGVRLVGSVIVARVYGAEAVGTVAVVDSLLMLAMVVTVLGTDTSVLRFVPEHIARHSFTSAFRVYRRMEWLVALVALATGGLLLAGSGLIAGTIFGKPHLSFVIALAALFVVAKSLGQLNTQAVRGLRLIGTFAFMQTLPALATLGLLVLGTLALQDARVPVYAYLGGVVVSAVAGALIMDRAFRRRTAPGDRVHPVPVREILTVSVPMFTSAALTTVSAQAGVIGLGIFRPEAEVGYYAIAVRVASLSTFVLAAINSMSAPTFARLFHAGQTEEALRVARKSAGLIFWMTSPLLLGIVVAGKPGLAWLFGADFGAAYGAMVILAFGQFVNAISGSTAIFLNMTGHEKVLRNITLGTTALGLGLHAALIPTFGIEGAATASMLATVASNVGKLLYIKARFGRTIGYVPFLGSRPHGG